MKNLLFLILALSSCVQEHKVVETTKRGDYEVSLLFTHEDCKVYRFTDDGRYRYFTNCSETISSFAEQHGKTSEVIEESNITIHKGHDCEK